MTSEEREDFIRFNTVNGKDCCNPVIPLDSKTALTSCFNTVNGKDCCNYKMSGIDTIVSRFNTVNGKDCCNLVKGYVSKTFAIKFQYRKR